MKNLALILAALALMTTGAYAQGMLSANEGNPDPNGPYLRTHKTTTTKDVVSSEGSTAPKSILAKTGIDFKEPLFFRTQTVVKQRPYLLDDAAWEAENAAQGSSPGLSVDDVLALDFPSFQSAQPQFSASNIRAWVYDGDDSGIAALASGGGLAAAQGFSRQNEMAGNNRAVSANANDSAGKTDATPQQGELELVDLSGPQRLIISNIASPEPNTVAMALIGGAALAWNRLARRRSFSANSQAGSR